MKFEIRLFGKTYGFDSKWEVEAVLIAALAAIGIAAALDGRYILGAVCALFSASGAFELYRRAPWKSTT